MHNNERKDIGTRFKKGQSGNPLGRPKGSKNDGLNIRDTLMKKIRVKDNDVVREVSKLQIALEVCLNKAIKGDLKSFTKIMEVADKNGLLEQPSADQLPIVIKRIIVDPRYPDEAKEYGGQKAENAAQEEVK